VPTRGDPVAMSAVAVAGPRVGSPRITSPPAQRWEAPLPSLRRQLNPATAPRTRILTPSFCQRSNPGAAAVSIDAESSGEEDLSDDRYLACHRASAASEQERYERYLAEHEANTTSKAKPASRGRGRGRPRTASCAAAEAVGPVRLPLSASFLLALKQLDDDPDLKSPAPMSDGSPPPLLPAASELSPSPCFKVTLVRKRLKLDPEFQRRPVPITELQPSERC
jgi:hypothetical protein